MHDSDKGGQLNYLIAGLAKSGTTILFSRMQQAISPEPITFFEPDREQQLLEILDSVSGAGTTLTKVLIGRVSADNESLRKFDRHVVIHRDPRDQFISMLLYLFYDFQLNGDSDGYMRARKVLARKVANPGSESTIDLYNLVSQLVGRAPIAVFNKLHRVQQNYIETFSPQLLRYEDFLDNKLQAVEGYLGFGLANSAEVPAEYKRVARSRAYGEWRSWLNKDDLAYINREWGEAIKRLGYSLSDKPDVLSISEATTLEYVAQFEPPG